MEDTLRELCTWLEQKKLKRLNPCFNGRYSQSPPQLDSPKNLMS